MDNVFISGIVSMYILDIKGVTFYLFGDNHTSMTLNNCQNKNNISCESPGGKCWTIDKLIEDLTIQPTKKDNRSADFYYETPINRDITKLTRRGDTWLSVFDQMFADCLTSNTYNCSINTNIHPIDVRQLQINNSILYVDILPTKDQYFEPVMIFIRDYIQSRSKMNFNDIRYLNDTILTIMDEFLTLIIALWTIVPKLFDLIYFGDNIDLESTILLLKDFYKPISSNTFIKNIYNKILDDVDELMTFKTTHDRKIIKIHFIANEYKMLKRIDENLASQIKSHIQSLAENFVTDIDYEGYMNHHYGLLEHFLQNLELLELYQGKELYLKYFELIETFMLNIFFYGVIKINALTVDMYALLKMFNRINTHSDLNKVFVFAGFNHVETIVDFIVNVENGKIIFEKKLDDRDDRCIDMPQTIFNKHIFHK